MQCIYLFIWKGQVETFGGDGYVYQYVTERGNDLTSASLPSN